MRTPTLLTRRLRVRLLCEEPNSQIPLRPLVVVFFSRVFAVRMPQNLEWFELARSVGHRCPVDRGPKRRKLAGTRRSVPASFFFSGRSRAIRGRAWRCANFAPSATPPLMVPIPTRKVGANLMRVPAWRRQPRALFLLTEQVYFRCDGVGLQARGLVASLFPLPDLPGVIPGQPA